MAQPQSAWRKPDFRKLWVGQAVSLLGSQISFLALPLTASLLLHASPFQMGLLAAIGTVPALLAGLVTGQWVDRVRRRPLLIAADLGRAVALLITPVAALLGVLRIEYLYISALLSGCFGVVFDIAYAAFLPLVVGREQLVESNSTLELSRSVAEVAGPGLAGALIDLLSAPVAILIDAGSFLVSALALWRIRTPEVTARTNGSQSVSWREIQEGLQAVYRNQVLRSVIGCSATLSLCNAAFEAIVFLYVPRELGISPIMLGLILAVGSVGSLGGAALGSWIVRRFGVGRTLAAALALVALGDALTPLAEGTDVAVVPLLVAGALLFGSGVVLYRIVQRSVRQAFTPDQLQGRVSSIAYVLIQGVVPAGALIGGVLGETLGLHNTLLLACAGELLALGWVVLSPLRRINQLEATGEE